MPVFCPKRRGRAAGVFGVGFAHGLAVVGVGYNDGRGDCWLFGRGEAA